MAERAEKRFTDHSSHAAQTKARRGEEAAYALPQVPLPLVARCVADSGAGSGGIRGGKHVRKTSIEAKLKGFQEDKKYTSGSLNRNIHKV